MPGAVRRGTLALSTVLLLLVIGVLIGLAVSDVARETPATVADDPPRDEVMAWLARILLALSVAWVVIGMLSARTRLVRRPGATAARAAWLSATRPWRARESALGLLSADRWLLLIVPAGLLIATRLVQSSFDHWGYAAAVLGAWVVFALLIRLFVGDRSPWPVIAAVGGAVVLRCIVTLAVLSVGGTERAWAVAADPALRVVSVTLGFALFAWVFVAAAWALVTQLGARRAIGTVIASVGAGLMVPALAVALSGSGVDVWSYELEVFPGGLSALGLAGALGIAGTVAWWAVAAGALMVAVGVATAWRARPPAGLPPAEL